MSTGTNEKEHGKGDLAMNTPSIVSQQEWEAERQQLLLKEKALTRSRDALAAERRRMPWLAVDKKYGFDGPKGKVSLLDLFEGRQQLIVYRAFFEPGVFGWPEHACRGCSLGADQVAHLAHLNARDTTLAYASRAPRADIARLKARMAMTVSSRVTTMPRRTGAAKRYLPTTPHWKRPSRWPAPDHVGEDQGVDQHGRQHQDHRSRPPSGPGAGRGRSSVPTGPPDPPPGPGRVGSVIGEPGTGGQGPQLVAPLMTDVVTAPAWTPHLVRIWL